MAEFEPDLETGEPPDAAALGSTGTDAARVEVEPGVPYGIVADDRAVWLFQGEFWWLSGFSGGVVRFDGTTRTRFLDGEVVWRLSLGGDGSANASSHRDPGRPIALEPERIRRDRPPASLGFGLVKRKILLSALGAWVLWRLLAREVPPRFEAPQERPTRLTGRTVLVGRHEFMVREAGPDTGLPLVLLHGWVYDSLATWHRALPLLAEHRRVITVDLRNHGRSERIRGPFTMEDAADDVAGVLDALGIERAIVVGYSMGGMTAQALARRHPEKVERLVLAATAADPLRFPRWVTGPAFVAGRALSRLDPFSLPRNVHRYLMTTGAVAPEHAAWLWASMLDRDTNLYYEAAFAIRRFDARGWIGRLRVPTLCIIPVADQLIPARRQRATAAEIPGARVLEIPGAHHEAMLTHAGQVAAAILEFADAASEGRPTK
jgi:pimeloyl-ACP methyl ester carboxylesterase